MTAFGPRLSRAMLRMSSEELARRLRDENIHVSGRNIRRWMVGPAVPRQGLDMLPALSRVLNIPVASLLPEAPAYEDPR